MNLTVGLKFRKIIKKDTFSLIFIQKGVYFDKKSRNCIIKSSKNAQ